MMTSRPSSVSNDRNTVSGAIIVAPSRIARSRKLRCIAASAAASCTRSLTPITSSSLASRAVASEAAPGGDLDEIGEIEFARGVVVADLVEHRQRMGAGDRHRAGVAAADRPLLGGRVLLLADGDENAVALDEAAVAGRVGRLEAERADGGLAAEALAQAAQRGGGVSSGVSA